MEVDICGNAFWILEVQNKEIMPADWEAAVICPTHRKCSKLACNNY
jgi:hypothetical protein